MTSSLVRFGVGACMALAWGCAGGAPAVPPRQEFATLDEAFQSLSRRPEPRAMAAAVDASPPFRWAYGQAWGSASPEVALAEALSRCEQHRLAIDIRSPCRTFAVGSERLWGSAIDPDEDLFSAVGAHDNEQTLRLVEKGADLAVRDERGCTPLAFAAFSGNLDGARILLERGADPNARCLAWSAGPSALFMATDRRLIELLVRHGADLELRSTGGETPLWSHAAHGNVDAVRALVELGADVNARDERGESVLDGALENRERRPAREVEALARILREAGAR
jgi:hypothetical protein